MGIKVLQSDLGVGPANTFLTKNFTGLSAPIYYQVDFWVPSSTITALGGSFTADFIELDAAVTDGVYAGVSGGGYNLATYGNGLTSTVLVPDAWHTLAAFYDGTHIYWTFDGSPLDDYDVALDLDAINSTGGFGADVVGEVYYSGNYRVGTTAGGFDIFCSDFEIGDFSEWDSVTGPGCSVVDDPLGTDGPTGPCVAVLTANFTASPLAGQPTLSVSFTDLSTPGPSGPITGWNWDFGDGGGSTVQNPSHNYTSPGRYTVTLTVTGTSPDGTDAKIRASYIFVFTATLYGAKKSALSDLYTIDPVTAALTSVGPIGSGMSGLAVDPTTNILYGTTSGASADLESLYTIDTTTGAGTLVGSSGGFGVQVHDIAFDADGNLYGVDTNGFLVTIDKATGALTYVSPGSGGTYSGGFDIDESGVGWRIGNRNASGGAAQTSTINLGTGQVTHVAAMSDGNFLDAGKFDPTGLFWASSPGQGTPLNLVTVEEGTGAVTVIGAFSESNVSGLAWLLTSTVPDFSASLVPNSIFVRDGVDALVHLNTTPHHGDTETITLTAAAPAGFTVTFPTNPITAGDINVPINIAVGSPANGTYTITIHCTGTDNSHDVNLTVHVDSSGTVPGIHLAS